MSPSSSQTNNRLLRLLPDKIVQILEVTTQSKYDNWFLLALFILESVLGIIIIQFVPYTEIDWIAYMEEVEMYENGERDYTQIKGTTGPLVYPAGFLYIFGLLRHLTSDGTNIRHAQYIFLIFYIITQVLVWKIYLVCFRGNGNGNGKSQQWTTIWSWRIAILLTCCSKRIHSIYILRLFNDGLTMLFLYLAIYLFLKHRWNIGCLIFSLAVSIKMNVLLFAPGLLLLLLQVSENWRQVVIVRLGICCALPQLILGAPFLTTYPISYLRKAFELDRVFFYQWTVNWKFLPEDVFVSKPLSILLLLFHLGTLAVFAIFWFQKTNVSFGRRLFLSKKQQKEKLSPMYIAMTLWTSNYIGICFARTLHYQFYSWYFHGIPFLLWASSSSSNADNNNKAAAAFSSYPILLRIVLWMMIEGAFLTFPATPWSSACLQVAHFLILLQIRIPEPGTLTDDTKVVDVRRKKNT